LFINDRKPGSRKYLLVKKTRRVRLLETKTHSLQPLEKQNTRYFCLLERRKPMLLLRLFGRLLLRLAERQFLALLFQLPPRITRLLPLGKQTCGKLIKVFMIIQIFVCFLFVAKAKIMSVLICLIGIPTAGYWELFKSFKLLKSF